VIRAPIRSLGTAASSTEQQAGLADPFTVVDDDPPAEPEYGND
jgi:hypothetical protein